MRVISVNLNGIRSAARKGFFQWLPEQQADVICVQETKAQMQHLHDDVFYPPDYRFIYSDALKKGYSGTGIYSRHEPQQTFTEFGWPPMDEEGRYVQMDFETLSVISLYLPSGTSGEHRQAFKYECMARVFERLQSLRNEAREYIICGDWNIAHTQKDIKNWRSNQKNSGFLPEERAWLDQVFDEAGYVDAFRVVNVEPEQYTWWSNRGKARENNVGWRIDYQVTTPGLRAAISQASIYKDHWFSDHAPLILDYDLERL